MRLSQRESTHSLPGWRKAAVGAMRPWIPVLGPSHPVSCKRTYTWRVPVRRLLPTSKGPWSLCSLNVFAEGPALMSVPPPRGFIQQRRVARQRRLTVGQRRPRTWMRRVRACRCHYSLHPRGLKCVQTAKFGQRGQVHPDPASREGATSVSFHYLYSTSQYAEHNPGTAEIVYRATT